jgi:hypothetical protein
MNSLEQIQTPIGFEPDPDCPSIPDGLIEYLRRNIPSMIGKTTSALQQSNAAFPDIMERIALHAAVADGFTMAIQHLQNQRNRQDAVRKGGVTTSNGGSNRSIVLPTQGS